jgi:GNAT superfamily N-acetyltransferase
MKVASFRELAEKGKTDALMVFFEELAPKKASKEWRFDPRTKDGPVGFCALDGNIVVGFVGVLDLKAKNIDGKVERVGGVYGVYTSPTHAQMGIATTLMEKAHQYFMEKGYSFSFLTTSRTIIAYNFYRKLGYEDAVDFCSAYKLVQKREAEKVGRREINWNKISKIYEKFSVDKTGFVVRDEGYLRWLAKPKSYRAGIKSKNILLGDEGYVIFRTEKEAAYVEEFVATNIAEMKRLVRLLEQQGKNCVYDRIVLDLRLLKTYQSMGYYVRPRSYVLLMAKPLADKIFRETYGGNFFMTNLDFF